MDFASKNESPAISTWRETLADFLRKTQGVEAIKVDFVAQKIEVATIGAVNEAELHRQLAETLRAIQAIPFAEHSAGNVQGVDVRQDSGNVTLQKPSCPTAPRLWNWRVFAWPEEEFAADKKAEVHEHAHEEHGHDHGDEDWRVLAAFAGGCALFAAIGGIATLAGAPAWLIITGFVLSMICGGWDAAKDSIENLPRGEFDIHFLMLAVAIGAASIGAWSEGALLLLLFSGAGALEAFAMNRTKRAIDSLFKEQPKTANIIDETGKEITAPIESVCAGNIVFVRPGDIFPVDGEILDGETAADESSLTGESLPVTKKKGDEAFGGTENLWGAVKIRVTRPVTESSLQKIIRLIQDAQKQKAPSQRFTDKFGTRYTLLILSLTAAMFFVWWLGFGLTPFKAAPDGSASAFYRAMTLLVVASPCALVLSIPSAILAAIAWGARHGILFRGGAAIEKLSAVDCVALDKTGTLTTGELSVERAESFPPGRETEVLSIAVSLEANATHPIARAIVAHGKRFDVAIKPVSQFQNRVGQGVQGRIDDALCVLGRRELITQGPLAGWAEKLPQPTPDHSEVWVIAGDLIGRILLRDQIRIESKPVLDALKTLGIRTVMLTGDRNEAAENVGAHLGLQEIRAGLSPADKVNYIRELERGGHRVAMVGDGVNDAPCLAAAHVAVGMGSRGSDAALEQCDVVLMNDKINLFLEARNLSVRARRIIKQNLAISLGTILVMVVSSIGIGIPLYFGVFMHEGSTVVVCLNSLRLLFGKTDRKV